MKLQAHLTQNRAYDNEMLCLVFCLTMSWRKQWQRSIWIFEELYYINPFRFWLMPIMLL